MTVENVVCVFLDDTKVATLPRPGDTAAFEVMPYLLTRPHGHWVRCLGGRLDNPTCGPSRVTMSTGQHARRHGASTNQKTVQNWEGGVDPQRKWPAILQAAGVKTAFWGKYENGYPWQNQRGNRGHAWVPPGWDHWHAFTNGVFDESTGMSNGYFDYSQNLNGVGSDSPGTDEDYSTDVFFAAAVDWIKERAAASEPFVAFLSLYAPHDTNERGVDHLTLWHPRHDSLFQEGERYRTPNHNEIMANPPPWIAETHARPVSRDLIDAEDARNRASWRAMRAVDEGMEQLMDALDSAGIIDETVVVFMGDNSNMSWQHRWRRKGRPAEESLTAYQMVRWPGATERDDRRPTSNIDWVPTLEDIYGVRMPDLTDGMSLRDLCLGDAPWREATAHYYEHQGDHSEDQSFSCVAGERFKYVRYANGQETLHDLVDDPFEMVNLVGDSDPDPMHRRMRRHLDRMLAVQPKHPTYPWR